MSPTKRCLAAAFSLAAFALSAQVELSIRFADKRIYFPEGEIGVKVTLANKSAATYRFKLAEDRVYSLAFELRSPTNRLLDPSESYRRALSSPLPAFYREIALAPGEEYSFVERVERQVRIDAPGSYTLSASFWPELLPLGQLASSGTPGSGAPGAAAHPLRSNTLLLSVRPQAPLPPLAELRAAETGETLRPEAVAPDEVVRRTIVARQRSRWNEFYLYLDLESLLLRDEARRRAYERESDSGRMRMVERYKADLRESVVDGDIVTVPVEFQVLETRYASQTGFVRVLQKFEYRGFRMLKEYLYELSQRDGIWYIVGYVVQNKGTE